MTYTFYVINWISRKGSEIRLMATVKAANKHFIICLFFAGRYLLVWTIKEWNFSSICLVMKANVHKCTCISNITYFCERSSFGSISCCGAGSCRSTDTKASSSYAVNVWNRGPVELEVRKSLWELVVFGHILSQTHTIHGLEHGRQIVEAYSLF